MRVCSLLLSACWLWGVTAAVHDYASCRDNLLNILKKPDSFILDMAAKFPQGQVQAELNAFLTTVTEEVGEGHTGQQAVQQAWYLAVASLPCVRTVCEIGFNAGHSATVWMSARPDIHLYSFDMGAKNFSIAVAKYMSDKFPGRISFTWGNSSETVPSHTKDLRDKCDIVVVDGGHDAPTAWQDTVNMRVLANPEFSIFVIDDVNCIADYCRGPEEAVARGVKEGMLEMLLKRAATWDGMVVGEDSMGFAMRGFSLGSFINKRSGGAQAQMTLHAKAKKQEAAHALRRTGAAREEEQKRSEEQQSVPEQGTTATGQGDAGLPQVSSSNSMGAGAVAAHKHGQATVEERRYRTVPKPSLSSAAEAGAAAAAAANAADRGGWWVAAALSLMALAAYVYWPRRPHQLVHSRPLVLPTHNHSHD